MRRLEGKVFNLIISGMVAAAIFASASARGATLSAETWLEAQTLSLIRVFAPREGRKELIDYLMPTADNVAIGRRIFFDPRLSGSGSISCASCHQPERLWTDGKAVAEGVSVRAFNTPTLIGVGRLDWLFWDGRSVGLSHQALAPLADRHEMGGDIFSFARLVATDDAYRNAYQAAFGELPDLACGGDTCAGQGLTVASNMMRFLGAFVSTIELRDTRFDRFISALSSGDQSGGGHLTPAELRGVRLFVGKGQCSACHSGSELTDGQFHNVLVREASGPASFSSGRYAGIRRLRNDPLSAYFASGSFGETVRSYVDRAVADTTTYAAFKTPTLKGLRCTAPYMHNGRLEKITDVVEHYSTFSDVVRPEHHDDPLLMPRLFSPSEKSDLIAFLFTHSPARCDQATRRPKR